MQKVVSTLFLLFLSASASGDLGKKIEELNSKLKSAGEQPAECKDCSVGKAGLSENDGSLMRSCVENICSNKDFSIADTLNKVYEEAAKPDSTYESEIQPIIRAIAEEDAISDVTQVSENTEWLKNPPVLSNPGAIRVFNLFSTLREFSQFQFVSENGKTIIDKAAARKTFPDLTDDELNTRIKIGNRVLDAFIEKAITETDPARVQLVYGSEFPSKVKEVLATFAKRQKQIEADPNLSFMTKLKTFIDLASGEKLREQFAQLDQINPDAIANLNQTNSVLNLFVDISTDEGFKKILDSPPIDVKKVIAARGTEELLKQKVKEQQAVLEGQTPVLSAKCRTAFEMAQQVLPSKKDLDLFKTKVDGLKNTFLDKTKGLMCESSAKDYASEVASWSAHFPLTKEQHLANLKTSLKRGLSEAKDWRENQQDINSSVYRDIIYSISVAAYNPQDDGPTATADDICENLMTNIIPDATTFLSKSFVTGPLTIKHKDATGIGYHELAHKLFHFMKYENKCADRSQFHKTRACLISIHTELSADELSEQYKLALKTGESRHESEDWADLISAQVDDKASNFACLFAQRLENSEYKELSLKNANSTGPHSSDLFRLLHLNFLKTGKMPVQCDQALELRGEKAQFKNCLQAQ